VPPQKSIEFQPNLPEGRYRLRWIGQTGSAILEVRSNFDGESFEFTSRTQEGNASISPHPVIRLKNESDQPRICVLEESWWYNTALKPSAVFLLQEFGDLFSKEHLATNMRLSLGRQVVLFTEIIGSNDKKSSDAKDHFSEIKKVMNQNRGTLVKTIGDSAMGAFAAVDEAFKAALEIQKTFGTKQTSALQIRISIDVGSVIAEKRNGDIEYLGSTVNFASQLQGFVGAHEIAVSEEIYRYLVRNPHSGSDEMQVTQREWKIDAATIVTVYVFNVSSLTQGLRPSA